MNLVHAYVAGLVAVTCSNPEVHLSVTQDPALGNEATLVVDYPPSNGQPDARDIWIEVERSDWSQGRGICFQARPSIAVRISISFMDANGVAYSAWTHLDGGVWQPVTVLFSEIRPNPFFQPQGAKRHAPIDVSLVSQLGFAPQDKGPGRIAVSRIQLC